MGSALLSFQEVIRLGKNHKTVKNGSGTTLVIDDQKYISVSTGGTYVTIRGNGKVLSFDKWDDLVNAVSEKKAVYHKDDCPDRG